MSQENKFRIYRTDSTKTSSGVPISDNICGANITPTTVINIPHNIPNAISVCTAFYIIVILCPKNLDITTPAPIAVPLKKPTSKNIRLPVDVTATKRSAAEKISNHK